MRRRWWARCMMAFPASARVTRRDQCWDKRGIGSLGHALFSLGTHTTLTCASSGLGFVKG